MKIDRLIGILSILLQQEKVTAPSLAEKFEVSRRTINRDIEVLCKAGIPLMTTQGRDGGISIIEGYRVDRTLITSSEMQSILTGLRGLDSISGTSKYQQLMDKLSVKQGMILASNSHIAINLSSHCKARLAPKIETIQGAIDLHHLLEFEYYSSKGESRRVVEPYMLIFQWSSWYLWGYSLERQDYRLFKLNRLLHLKDMGQSFEPRSYPAYDSSPERVFPPLLDVTAVFESGMKWRLIEEYGVESFEEMKDGKLLFQLEFTDKEHLFFWLLSFGNQVELLEPKELRPEIGRLADNIRSKYNDDI